MRYSLEKASEHSDGIVSGRRQSAIKTSTLSRVNADAQRNDSKIISLTRHDADEEESDDSDRESKVVLPFSLFLAKPLTFRLFPIETYLFDLSIHLKMSDDWEVKILCMGAGYVGGPTMAVIAKQCPKVCLTILVLQRRNLYHLKGRTLSR